LEVKGGRFLRNVSN